MWFKSNSGHRVSLPRYSCITAIRLSSSRDGTAIRPTSLASKSLPVRLINKTAITQNYIVLQSVFINELAPFVWNGTVNGSEPFRSVPMHVRLLDRPLCPIIWCPSRGTSVLLRKFQIARTLRHLTSFGSKREEAKYVCLSEALGSAFLLCCTTPTYGSPLYRT